MKEEDDDGATTTPRRRPASRRTRLWRMRSANASPVPLPTQSEAAEETKLATLNELTNPDGGVKDEQAVLTVVMLMHAEQRPRIHERLLEMVMRSSSAILEAFVKTKQFLPALYNWMGPYSKEGSQQCSDMLIKIVQLYGRLPMSRDEIRELRNRLRKLRQTVLGDDVRREVDQLLEAWDEKKREDEKSVTERRSEGVLSLNSWNKRKAGKAFVAADPEVKCRKPKLSRKFSGPLSASHAVASRGSLKRAVTSSPRMSPQLSTARSLDLDAVSPEAKRLLDKMSVAQLLKKHKDSAPSQLIHSMEAPPRDAVFYTQQLALYHELRSQTERSDQLDQETKAISLEVPWQVPNPVQLPSREVKRAIMESTEKGTQSERERSVPATESGVLFSSLEEKSPVMKVKGTCTAPIPFFPHNHYEFEVQQKVMMDAGVAVPSLLGKVKSETPSESPMGPLNGMSSPPISDASNLTDPQKHH